MRPAWTGKAVKFIDLVSYFRDVNSPQLGRLDAVFVHDLLQLTHSETGHIQFVLDLPKMRIADGIVAAMLLQDLSGLVYGAAEGE